MNEFTIGKRMITITIDEDMFEKVYEAMTMVESAVISSSDEVWKFFTKINVELNG